MKKEEESNCVVMKVEDDYPKGGGGSIAAAAAAADQYHSCCRICHEGEDREELEAPCACSGTAKFAHRECIQRWCDVKGDTTCEICQQKYMPNYTATPSKKAEDMMQRVVTISGTFEIPRGGEIINMDDDDDNDDDEDHSRFLEAVEEEVSDCMSAAERSAAFCKTVAVMLTALLLLKQVIAIATGVVEQTYPFSLITVLVLRATGIVVPMYIIIRTLDKMRRSITKHNHLRRRLRMIGVGMSSPSQLRHVIIDVHHTR